MGDVSAGGVEKLSEWRRPDGKAVGVAGRRVATRLRCGAVASIFAALVLAWAMPAAAQTALHDSIASRARPDYDPIGIVVGPRGSFLLFPKFTLSAEFTDNLFDDDNDTVSDQAMVFEPEFKIQSDWVNHSLTLAGKAVHTRYLEETGENSLDYNLDLTGRLDVLAGSSIDGGVTLARRHTDRGDPDDPGQTRPTVSHVGTLRLSGVHNPDVILLRLDLTADRSDFRDVGVANNDDQDRLVLEARTRLGYEWVPGSTAFVEGAYNARDFREEVDDNGLVRSSDGWEILLGNTLDLSGVTFAELGLGYLRQVFDDPVPGGRALGPTEGFSFAGRTIWNATDLLTISAETRRKVNDTTIENAASAFTSSFELKADYEMLENLIFDGKINYDIESFDGIDREDTVLTLNFGARYLLGPNLVATAKYEFLDRISDDAGAVAGAVSGSFRTNTFRISITAQF